MLLGRSAVPLLHTWEANERASQFPSKELSLGAVTILTGKTLDSAVMTTRAEMYH
jgi:hypothetical protein